MSDTDQLLRDLASFAEYMTVTPLHPKGMISVATEFLLSLFQTDSIDSVIKVFDGWLRARPSAEIELTIHNSAGEIAKVKWAGLKKDEARDLLKEYVGSSRSIRVMARS